MHQFMANLRSCRHGQALCYPLAEYMLFGMSRVERLSHLPLLSGYDEPKTLSYQINLFGPIGADVRQS